MKIQSVAIRSFKRFTDLKIEQIPDEARLVVLVGPNGSGKSSLIEAFNFYASSLKGSNFFDKDYHSKIGGEDSPGWSEMNQKITITFDSGRDPRSDAVLRRKALYVRSAYRHEPDFQTRSLNPVEELLADARRPQTLMQSESRVSDNYNRIVSSSVQTLFDPAQQDVTARVITDRIVGRVREAMDRVFPDLKLAGVGRPLESGTFHFDKGTSHGYQYKNLSAGEKAAFDLLLDFVTKSEAFDDTVFCIDEPELHMHTRLQSRLLAELYRQIPSNCQLWIATHSVGMMRKAFELKRQHARDVVFLDFENHDFDSPVVLRPMEPTRQFWKKVFHVALDDLAGLVAPGEIIFCEGKKEPVTGRRKPTFDASVYRTVFGGTHANTEFIALGDVTEVDRDAATMGAVLGQLFQPIRTWSVYDRDDRSQVEIDELLAHGIRVPGRRDLENYLWDDEVITKLCTNKGLLGVAASLIAEKQRLLTLGVSQGQPADDVKWASGQLYNATKSQLSLTGCGNDAEAFARDTLALLITPDMVVYQELERSVFPLEPTPSVSA